MFKLKKNLFIYLILTSMILIAANSAQILICVKKSLGVCFSSVIPSLFPFMVLSSMFVESCDEDSFKILGKVTGRILGIRKSANAAFICGLICGYPIGAKCTAELYRAKKVSASEAQSLIAYSNNSGPLFVIGAVGVGIFGSLKTGLILYAVQIFSALCAARILKAYTIYSVLSSKKINEKKNGFTGSVCNAAVNVINICGFIVFFSVINELIKPVISHFPPFVRSVAFCFIEITNAVVELKAESFPYAVKLAMVSFALGWSGISVHMQVKSLIKDTGLSMKKYYITRLFIGIMSSLITYITLTRFDKITLYLCKEKWIVAFAVFVLCIFLFWHTKKEGENSPSELI